VKARVVRRLIVCFFCFGYCSGMNKVDARSILLVLHESRRETGRLAMRRATRPEDARGPSDGLLGQPAPPAAMRVVIRQLLDRSSDRWLGAVTAPARERAKRGGVEREEGRSGDEVRLKRRTRREASPSRLCWVRSPLLERPEREGELC
jgi:hypothetical protein